MPRGGEKDNEKDKSKGDHADNAAGDTSEKSDDKKKSKRYNQYGNRNRNNRYYRKNRYHGGGDRRHFKRAKFDIGERLKEVDLGITEYGGDTEGFTGTIKERFTDFVVHEISINGEIAKLTNDEIPPDPEDLEDIEDLKKKIPEDVWEKLQTITENNASVEIDVTNMTRDQRRCIHVIVKKLTTVLSETKEIGNKKVIVFSKECTNKFGNRAQDNRKDWSMRGGDYCHFILHKVNIDTMDALNQISRVLRLKSSIFNYAGTKDRRAKTTQWISVKKMNPKSIANAAKLVKGVFVGNFKFEKEPLKLGKLDGNRFTIALRNVTASDELIEKAMISLRDNGFINYYGLQRFGAIAAIPTYEIGKALLQGNWNEAIDLILKPREGEQDTNLAEARLIYKDSKDSRLAYQKIGRNDKIEAKLLWGLNLCGQKNPQGALDMVPRNTLLMYIHAYQSFVWNKIVSKRIKDFGLKPIVGDLVYENPDSKDEIEAVNDEANHAPDEDAKINSETKTSKIDESDSKKEESEKAIEKTTEESQKNESKNTKKDDAKIEDDKNSEKDDNERQIPKVKILTEEDLPNYTINDVVIPQPGWKVTYPPYAQEWFDEQLEKDGLTKDLKQKNKKYTLSGFYRKIVQVPQDLSWRILRYSNKSEDLILSDIDEMKDIEPPKDNPDGTFKALIIQMSLKSSAYATMALREVLKCDTSSQTHAAQSAAFHAEHEKNEEAKRREANKQSVENSEVEENILHVENLKLKERSSDDTNHSTEDETNDKKTNVSTSSLLEDSIMEENIKDSGKSSEKTNNSVLDNSTAEEKMEVNESHDSISKSASHKHETDTINDSGIEPGSVMNA